MQTDYHIAIVGGGLVGAGLACALADSGLRVGLLEAVPMGADEQPSYDDRGLSLSLASRRILEAVSAWPAGAGVATPIEHIHVSDRGHFGFVRLHAAELGLSALGYVVVARQLGRALLERLDAADNIDFRCPARVETVSVAGDQVRLQLGGETPASPLTCRLLVVADGARSPLRQQLGVPVREKDYRQTAIVANISPQRGHGNWAFERFTETGPLALLPLPEQRCALVCTVPGADAEAYLALDDGAMLDYVQARFGRRLGRFTRIGERRSYPLASLEVDSPVRERVLLFGNAAHAVHPNAAQGLNLALRDVAGLAEVLRRAEPEDVGNARCLEQYRRLRQVDQRRVLRFSDGLSRLFYNRLPGRTLARDAGMLLLDLWPGLKHGFMRRAMGIGPHQPAIVYGDPRHGY